LPITILLSCPGLFRAGENGHPVHMDVDNPPSLVSYRRCDICSQELHVEFLPNKTSVVVAYLCSIHGLISLRNPFAR
jgi:hypothetical protein